MIVLQFDACPAIGDNTAAMYRIEPDHCDGPAWSDKIAACPGLSLLQCGEYGDAKAALDGWQVERGKVHDGERPVAYFQALVKNVPILGGGLAWISRGPLFAGGAPADVAETLAALRHHYAGERGYYLRIAPAAAPAGFETTGGYETTATPGWASAALDISQDEEALRSGLRQNWRNASNKFERSELDRQPAGGEAEFDTFTGAYETFIRDNAIPTTVTAGLIRALQDRLAPNRRLMAFNARLDGQPAAGVLIARYGPTAEYLAAYSTNEARKHGAGQGLLWRAMMAARKQGLSRFDVGGMDPDLTPSGIFKFKQGTGALPYRLAPEIEAFDGGLSARLVRWRVNRARRAG